MQKLDQNSFSFKLDLVSHVPIADSAPKIDLGSIFDFHPLWDIPADTYGTVRCSLVCTYRQPDLYEPELHAILGLDANPLLKYFSALELSPKNQQELVVLALTHPGALLIDFDMQLNNGRVTVPKIYKCTENSVSKCNGAVIISVLAEEFNLGDSYWPCYSTHSRALADRSLLESAEMSGSNTLIRLCPSNSLAVKLTADADTGAGVIYDGHYYINIVSGVGHELNLGKVRQDIHDGSLTRLSLVAAGLMSHNRVVATDAQRHFEIAKMQFLGAIGLDRFTYACEHFMFTVVISDYTRYM